MTRAIKRIRCAACRGWIEIGEAILFTDVKYHRREMRMPIHPWHEAEYNAAQEKLRKAIERSESDTLSIFSFEETRMLPRDPSDNWVI